MHTMIEYENIDGKFLLYQNDAISMHLMRGDLWEPHFKTIVSYIMPRNLNVLDCGANFGYNSVVMGKLLNSDSKLICFEPQRKIWEQLKLNLNKNEIRNYEAYCKCLSEKSNKVVHLNQVDYNQSWVNIGDTSIGSGGEETTTIAIDDLNLQNVGFIKIDVQGYELFVIRGAINTIKRCNPIIFVELESHQLVKFGCTKEDVVGLLKELGYLIFNIKTAYYNDDYLCVKDIDQIKNLNNKLFLTGV